MKFFIRKLVVVFGLIALAACSAPANVDAPQKPMGNFRLGHNIVVISEPEIMPFSREVEDEVWQEAMTGAMAERFGDFEGDKIYHIGVKIEAYALAIPGVPVLFTPKSVLVLAVNVWDDAAGEKLTEEAESFTVFESPTADTIIGSGLTQSKEKQMKTLTENAAKAIQDWILENPEWIGMPPLDEAQAKDLSDSSADEISEEPLSDVEDNVADDTATGETDISTEAAAEEESSN